MSIETLLSRLDGVKETGHGKYVARCPAHDDRSPSLAIKECSDGRILLHDFAGCETEDILSAVGLEFGDLYPERPESDYQPRRRQRFDARQVLAALNHEILVVCVIAERLLAVSRGEDQERLLLATARLTNGSDMAETIGTPIELAKIRRSES